MVCINRRKILTGALILTAAGVITRVLGFVYRIYMSNLMGAEGMGLYQLIMPVYALAWSISCAGFNTTLSKLTAQEKARGEYGNMRRMLVQSAGVTTLLGVLLTVVLFFGAGFLADNFFHDARVLLPLQILSLAFPFMAAGTCMRGYFIGLQEAAIPAVNQVLEQVVRMLVIYLLAARFVPLGLEYAAAVAVIAIVVEEMFSFLFVFAAYKRHKKKMLGGGAAKNPPAQPAAWRYGMKLNFLPKLSQAQVFTLIMGMALPLTGNRVAGSLLAAWENVLIPRRLQIYGLSATEAISEFGRISGMAIPLIYFPTAVLTALSVTIVPAVAEAVAAKQERSIAPVASKALLFAAVTGMGAAALFMFFSHELGLAIYNQPIGVMLMLLGVMCPFIYMQIVLSGVLNGLGCQMFIFRNSLLSSGISIGFIYVFVPQFGLVGYIFGWLFSLIVAIGLGLYKIRQFMPIEMEFSRWFLRPMLAAAAAGLASRYIADRWLLEAAGLRAGLAMAIALLLAVYLAGVLLTGCITRQEIREITSRR
ncbi:MAG: oligosaccharide flippase family protein [Defluviitaleaceae bacterium]|nr:oligosaccharide flippase family protein [Defluviitaleaceae bacterium]